MAEISNYISYSFILLTIVTVWLFYKSNYNKKVLLVILTWMLIVGLLGIKGFYQKPNTFPPRFTLLLVPPVLFLILIFSNKTNTQFLNNLNLKWLTILHTVRVPVEIILYYLFLEGLIPDLMTFDGYNFDIIAGISAPIVFYLMFKSNKINKRGLLIWNFICLGLLLNILTIAILSAETPLQQFAFEQPNIGVTYFPFVWLPAVIVPIVLFSHIASIKQLLSYKK